MNALFNRTLMALRDENRVAISKRSVEIFDRDALADAGEFDPGCVMSRATASITRRESAGFSSRIVSKIGGLPV